ncbi:carbohydrate ABC transporter permease [Schaalia sp. lx-100]|uniref:carbohydrate ABC transporter permease n=1 Tax=Schaalia sp. lx-100 TaxID=2899081 RepID=UPI001E42D812|nr:carbohydrate ABC transporter permease [Schaalia sp. lx-100]MCD4557750.1 carbohydrate ABC transporter permease [Schaalia sp. lx-100]
MRKVTNRKRTSGSTLSRFFTAALRWGIIIFWVTFTMLPLYAAFCASLTKYENLGKSFLYPADWQWKNYIDVFTRIPLLSFLRATLIYAVGTSLLCVLLGTFAAYAFSRFRFVGRQTMLTIVFVSQLVPQVIIVIPLFLMLRDMHLYDAYLGVILAIVSTGIAFTVLLLKSFFDGIPLSLEEAAAIDGASRIRILTRVVLPLSKSGIATAFALSFFTGWGQYLYPLILTRQAANTPVTVGVARLIDNQTPWEIVMAATLISVLPAVVIYMFVQKFLTRGLLLGAVK